MLRLLSPRRVTMGAGPLPTHNKTIPSKKFLQMAEEDPRLTEIRDLVRSIPDFPKPGIDFKDITTVLRSARGMQLTIDLLYDRYVGQNIDAVVALESRGFVFGAPLAYRLGIGLVLVRKKGKLPVGHGVEVISQPYGLEYGEDEMEIHTDAISVGQRVVIIDDLVATGGTLEAACILIERLQGEIVELACMIDLPACGNQEKLAGRELYTMIEFEGH